MNYLVDTDWIIDGIGGVTSAVQTLDQLGAQGLAVSVVSLGELFDGAYGSSDPGLDIGEIRSFLSGYAVLGLDEPAMELFGRTRQTLRRQGNLIPDMDLMIAATAIRYGLILVTRNLRHFSPIPGLTLY